MLKMSPNRSLFTPTPSATTSAAWITLTGSSFSLSLSLICHQGQKMSAEAKNVWLDEKSAPRRKICVRTENIYVYIYSYICIYIYIYIYMYRGDLKCGQA
ncbi:hypothetical protein KSP39_PZI018705 [Platanthera zijinensis]|uniref:Uncharacterized protein n=1 Tax=Platanthera zijinensis TaxID=2320716 RepID=A0AAP0B3L5_9ASPA